MNKKNILVYVTVFFIVFVIEFALNSYLSFSMGDIQYLYYQNILNLLPLFTVFLGFGTPFTALYLTSLSKNNKKIYMLESNLFVFYFSLSMLFIFLLLFIFNYIKSYVVVALILGFFNAIKQNSVNFYLAKRELNKSSFIRLNQKLMYLLVIIICFVLLTINTNAELSIVLILGEFLGFIILLIKYRVLILSKFKKIKSIVKIARYAFMSNLFGMICLVIPIVLLNYFNYPIRDIIIFSIAYTLLKYSGVIIGPFMQLITPHFTPLKKDFLKVKELYIRYIFLISLIACIISIIMFFLSEYIIGVFFNKEYNEAVDLFKVLVFCIPFLLINSFNTTLISSVIDVRLTYKIVFLVMLIMLILNMIILYYHQSIMILTYGLCVFYILSMLISSFVFLKKINQSIQNEEKRIVS